MTPGRRISNVLYENFTVVITNLQNLEILKLSLHDAALWNDSLEIIEVFYCFRF